MLDADAAAGLFFVQERLDQERSGQNFVARAVEQIGARHVRGAHRFALAAAQAVFDAGGDGPNVALLHDQRLVPHQTKAGRVSAAQIRTAQRSIAVEQVLMT